MAEDNLINPEVEKKEDKTQKVTPKKQEPSEEVMALIQTAMEQVKFEIKKEYVEAITAKSQQLAEVDPVTSTTLKAVAGAINESVSDVVPLGGNQELNNKPEAGIVEKQAEDIAQILRNTTKEKLKKVGFFDKVAGNNEDEVEEAVNGILDITLLGMQKFAEDNDVDFSDPNTHEMLEELIEDGSLFQIGLDEKPLGE